MKTITGFVVSACLAIWATTARADDAARIRFTAEESQFAPPGGQLGTASVPGTAYANPADDPAKN